jgi:hypothetical protein
MCRLIETEELLDRRNTGGKYGDDSLYIEPGMMWFLPWIFDHQDPDLEQYLPDLLKDAKARRGKNSTSRFYLEDWATQRDPICIMLPHAGLFYPDAVPSGGTGWRVLGTAPKITLEREVIVRNTIRVQIIEGVIRLSGYHHG